MVTFLIAMLMGAGLAQAETKSIVLSGEELKAMQTLIHFSDLSIYLNERKGKITPTPALRYLKVAPRDFDIPTNVILDLVDLKINDIQSIGAQLGFHDGAIAVNFDFEDLGKEVTSSLGSIDFQGLAASALLKIVSFADGSQGFIPSQFKINGSMTGTGVLRSRAVLERTRKLANQVLIKQLTSLFESEVLRAKIQEVLLLWASFSTGENWDFLVPGSMRIESGFLIFSVQR